jgi:hypothetical protein
VASPILADSDDTDCQTIIPFATLPAPGRIALRPGGDNVTYTRAHTPPTTVLAENMPPNKATHVGNWLVQRVVHHRGKVTHRSKLQFRVQWSPLEGMVSPDTWIPWNTARLLLATKDYVNTVPLLHYLLPLMPVGIINEARAAGSPALQCSPHSAHSTTGIDGQPLRYNRLMKGPDATGWIVCSRPQRLCTSFGRRTSRPNA